MLLNRIFDVPNTVAWIAYMVLVAVSTALASQSMEGWGWCLFFAFIAVPSGSDLDRRDRFLWLAALVETVGLAILLIVLRSDIGWGWLLALTFFLIMNSDKLKRRIFSENGEEADDPARSQR